MEQNELFTEAILGPIDPMELGVPMTREKSKYLLAGRNPKLLPKQWLSDPMRRRIDAKLEVPPTLLVDRDPPIHSDSLSEKLRPLLLPMLLGLAGGGLLMWGVWRSGVLK